MTEQEWRDIFDKANTEKDKFMLILKYLNGYGVEYDYDPNDDAMDLMAAFDALQPQPLL